MDDGGPVKPPVLGIDLGSVSAKVVVVQDGRIQHSLYRRHLGRPAETLALMLEEEGGWSGLEAVFTGSSSVSAAAAAGTTPVNEVVSLAAAVTAWLPEVRSVIEMGGQDSKLLRFREKGGSSVFDDFSMNSICAAGTGSFLDQQASRLGLSPEDMGRLSLECEDPPRIAGRCSVFAKSDMIHLQQIGTPVPDIVAGLCFAVARNFRSSIASGKDWRPPVAFVGGVAANSGMVRAFRSVLGEGDGIFVPADFRCLVAAGAVLASAGGSAGRLGEDFVEHLRQMGEGPARDSRQEPLARFRGELPVSSPAAAPGAVGECYLGVDVGSISTNVVAVDPSGRLLASEYLMTAGRPLEAVKQGLRLVHGTLGDRCEVLGLGTTGSGRYMIGDFLGADVVRNEITAQARAAVEYDPEADTVFEIGGQDSKYISLSGGRVIDFEMNKVCAAGTGSFLEEQAERLGLRIGEFGGRALGSRSPSDLGERCTVFMESDILAHQAAGTDLDDMVAGLCYSIVRNYLHRVVGDRRIGSRILLQGGIAFNGGVVAAFNSVLGEGRSVTVPPDHHVTGAIGAALLARDEKAEGPTSFRGFGLGDTGYEQDSFVCSACSNRCEIHSVTLEDGRQLFYGSRCEKYEQGSDRTRERGRNWFREREKLLLDGYAPPESDQLTVGIPRALWFWELFPFWRAYFDTLGVGVVLSDPSSSTTVHRGVENVAAETCFPVKIAHGHVMNLLEKRVDCIFLPSILRGLPQRGDFTESYNCPYVEASPYLVDAGLGLSRNWEVDVLMPVVDFSLPEGEWRRSLLEVASRFGADRKTASRACDRAVEAQQAFTEGLRALGRTALAEAGDRYVLAVVSRPYNGSDPAVSVDLPEKLARLGADVIPIEFLELPLERVAAVHPNMYWHYGQRILASAIAIREDERLNAVYITNFGCGPDSFIHHFFDDIMGDKPYLTIEIDEHAADAGVITRCEAFFDSLAGRRGTGTGPVESPARQEPDDLAERTIWVPYLGDATFTVTGAARKYGVNAVPMPPTSSSTVALGRSVTSGKECYPAIITSGNMLSILEKEDPAKTAFFMGTASGPCRFGQYCSYHRLLLDRMGYRDVPIITASSRDAYSTVSVLSGMDFQIDLLKGMIATDVLKGALYRLRPYESEPGSVDRVYARHLDELRIALETGRSVRRTMERAASDFAALPIEDRGDRPLIMVFGEIYVRNDPYANADTPGRIERLGGEVLHTPVVEWFEFVNHSFAARSRDRKRIADLLKAGARGKLMSTIRKRMEAPFRDITGDRPVLTPEEILEAAVPYMRENVGGEAILCIGAPLALAAAGRIDGAVNVLPFTCLPGTIVTAISKRLRSEHPDLPWLNLAFDGQEDTNNEARLEAFMYQVHEYRCSGRVPGELEGTVEHV
jgi:predicted CoA-substrate-specific enzyme activase